MESKLKHIAELLKLDLAQGFEFNSGQLMAFVNEYVADASLRNKIIVASLDYRRATDSDVKDRLKNEISHLIDEILQSYEERESEVTGFNEAIQFFTENAPPNREEEVVFQCKELGKSFRRSGFHLQGMNLELKTGEITSVVGENGNGKTTLFRVIAGEIKHDEGNLAYPALAKGPKDAMDWYQIKRQIAYVPQDLPKWYGSLISNIHFELSTRGIKGVDNERETNYIIQRLGLEDYLDRNWNELSGGYKLRFALAMALVWKPKLLLIDEPLANLDIKAQQIILNDLVNLAKSFKYPISVIISSQHLHEIEAVSDKILFLKDGKESYYGDIADIGEGRSINTFELGTREDPSIIKEKLRTYPDIHITYNGMYFVLTAPLEMTNQRFLRILVEEGVEVLYFRNVSQSVKRLFEM